MNVEEANEAIMTPIVVGSFIKASFMKLNTAVNVISIANTVNRLISDS